jgi:hypothetical protein
MTDGPGSTLRPTYCGIGIAVKDRDGDMEGGSGVATLSSRVQGSAKEAAKWNNLNEKQFFSVLNNF